MSTCGYGVLPQKKVCIAFVIGKKQPMKAKHICRFLTKWKGIRSCVEFCFENKAKQ
jgi:hypothetical protein